MVVAAYGPRNAAQMVLLCIVDLMNGCSVVPCLYASKSHKLQHHPRHWWHLLCSTYNGDEKR